MQKYADLLIKVLKDKASFHNSSCIIDSDEEAYEDEDYNMTPSQLITKLNELGYKFTQSDFNKFISQVTYLKATSFIVKNHTGKKSDDNKAIKIMFTHFDPSEKQFDMIISCYTKMKRYQRRNSNWIRYGNIVLRFN